MTIYIFSRTMYHFLYVGTLLSSCKNLIHAWPEHKPLAVHTPWGDVIVAISGCVSTPPFTIHTPLHSESSDSGLSTAGFPLTPCYLSPACVLEPHWGGLKTGQRATSRTASWYTVKCGHTLQAGPQKQSKPTSTLILLHNVSHIAPWGYLKLCLGPPTKRWYT